MRSIAKFLLSAVSAGALAAANFARPVRDGRAEPFAPTPRKPEFKPKVKQASAKRAARRLAAKAKFDRQMRKERAIGTDPIFAHGHRSEAARSAWLKQSREWDQAHG